MLPDFRALFAVLIGAVVLMAVAFGTAAKLRAAREMQSTPLEAARRTLLSDAALQRAFGAQTSIAPEATPLSAAPDVTLAAPSPAVAPPPAKEAALPPPDMPETTGSIDAAARADQLGPTASAPSAEPPVGGPLMEPAALAPGPELMPSEVPKKPPAAVRRVYGSPDMRARDAARRIAEEQAKRARNPQPATSYTNDVSQ